MRKNQGRTARLVVGFALLVTPIVAAGAQGAGVTPASTTNVIEACYVPASGTIYRISTQGSPAAGAPSNCVNAAHVRFGWNLQGVAGAAGAAGTAGAKGDAGPKGDAGANGASGVDGAPGAKGDPGSQGDPGLKGIDGAAGAAGATGATGAPGATGPRGLTGAPGAVGPAGAAGTQGPQGVQGIPGLSGYQVVTKTITVSPALNVTSAAALYVHCPAGKDVIGGGARGSWYLDGSYPLSPVTNSAPYGWYAHWSIPSDWNGITYIRSFKYDVYAICAKVTL